MVWRPRLYLRVETVQRAHHCRMLPVSSLAVAFVPEQDLCLLLESYCGHCGVTLQLCSRQHQTSQQCNQKGRDKQQQREEKYRKPKLPTPTKQQPSQSSLCSWFYGHAPTIPARPFSTMSGHLCVHHFHSGQLDPASQTLIERRKARHS